MPLFFFWFDHSLGARTEICQNFSLVKNFILKLSDLYEGCHEVSIFPTTTHNNIYTVFQCNLTLLWMCNSGHLERQKRIWNWIDQTQLMNYNWLFALVSLLRAPVWFEIRYFFSTYFCPNPSRRFYFSEF